MLRPNHFDAYPDGQLPAPRHQLVRNSGHYRRPKPPNSRKCLPRNGIADMTGGAPRPLRHRRRLQRAEGVLSEEQENRSAPHQVFRNIGNYRHRRRGKPGRIRADLTDPNPPPQFGGIGDEIPTHVVDYRIEFGLLGTGIHTGGVIASVSTLSARVPAERSSPLPRAHLRP
jgi:hypothetical protein